MARKYNLVNRIVEGFPEEVIFKHSPICRKETVKSKTGTIPQQLGYEVIADAQIQEWDRQKPSF